MRDHVRALVPVRVEYDHVAYGRAVVGIVAIAAILPGPSETGVACRRAHGRRTVDEVVQQVAGHSINLTHVAAGLGEIPDLPTGFPAGEVVHRVRAVEPHRVVRVDVDDQGNLARASPYAYLSGEDNV